MDDQIKKEIKSLILSKKNKSDDISDTDYQEILNKVFELGVDPVEFKKLFDSLKSKVKVPINKIVDLEEDKKNNSDSELIVTQEKIKSKEIEVNCKKCRKEISNYLNESNKGLCIECKKKNSNKKRVLMFSFFIMSLAVLFVFKDELGFKKNTVLSSYYNIISYSFDNNYKRNIVHGYKNGTINNTSIANDIIFDNNDPEIEIKYIESGTIFYRTVIGDLGDLILETNCGLSNCEGKFDFSLQGRWNGRTSGSGDFVLNLDKEGFLSVNIIGDDDWKHWTEMYLYEYTRILEIVNDLHKEQRGTDYYDIRKEYYDNGNIKNLLVVDNYARDYYRNGQLKKHTTFVKNSEKIVSIKEYSKDGQLIDDDPFEPEEDIRKAEKGDIDMESLISEYLQTEDNRNFDEILGYYDMDNISRYWNLNYPSIEEMRDAYNKAWSISANSKNQILSINKLNNSTFDTYIKYTFYHIKNKEWKTSNTVVRFVFGQNNKLVEVYGKSID